MSRTRSLIDLPTLISIDLRTGALAGMLMVGCASRQDTGPVEADVLPPSPSSVEQTASAEVATKAEPVAEAQAAIPGIGIGTQPTTEQTNTTQPVATTARPTATLVPTSPATSQPGGTKMARPVGVAECDQYIDLIRKCFSGQSAESKASMEQALSKTTEGWAQTARDPKARAGLADTCRLASDALLKTVCQDKGP